MTIRLSNVIFWGILVSITLRLVLSNWFLDSFYPYTDEGGAFFQKIHPATYLVLLLFPTVVLLRSPVRFFAEQRRLEFGLLQFFVAIVLIILISLFRFGTSGAAYLVDTFLAAALYGMLALYLDPPQRIRLASVIILIVGANAIIALSEFGLGYHLFEPEKTFGFFRASALFGHPLANALITASVALIVLKLHWWPSIKFLTIALLFFSLLAFGARAATATLLLGVSAFLAVGAFVSEGPLKNRYLMIPVAYSFLAALVASSIYVVFATELGSSISERLFIDNSVEHRYHAASLIQNFSMREIFFGFGPDVMYYALDRNPDIQSLENFWVVLLLSLGIPVFLLFGMSFFYLMYFIVRKGNWIDGLIVLMFLFLASTNNSLSSKNAALAVVLLLILCLQDVGGDSNSSGRQVRG